MRGMRPRLSAGFWDSEAMKRTAIVVAALLAPLLLVGCTTATPYQPLTPGSAVSGGYSDQVLDDTHLQVSFSGNDVTPRASKSRTTCSIAPPN